MRLNFILVLSIASSVTAQALNGPTKVFCSDKIEGDGGCEANDQETFCCNEVEIFELWEKEKTATVISKDKDGGSFCSTKGSAIKAPVAFQLLDLPEERMKATRRNMKGSGKMELE
ncbi:hypothetical protein HYALB_00008006 [Hymenoscyphus albidus]|uniref:Hydrophobin n=1 Tax=Hymenoscyphus albidus TaxID=595503 RepID=A0A9N9LD88_9HELO|nr:hypothetical protein HYALB_00008006 [Hymenoscyphus albidus]